MKLRTVLSASLLAGALAAPAYAQPHADVHVTVKVPPVGEHGRREWKVEHPVVTSYTPLKGEVGSKVVIRGQHFSKDMHVVWGTTEIPGAVVTENTVEFTVPKGAANGTVYLRGGGLGRDLVIGDYEVAKFDKDAWHKADEDRRKEAEKDWKERKIEKDKAKRDAELAAAEAEAEKTREKRREDELNGIRKAYERAFLADPATVAELQLHAERTAKLQRIQALAADANDEKLGIRAGVDIKREDSRHDQRMAALKAAFKGA